MDPLLKIQGFMSDVPNIIANIISTQTLVKQTDEYFAKVEREIKYFKKYGTFKIPESNKETETNSGTVLNENIMKNPPRIKLERISEAIPSEDVVSANRNFNRESLKENIKIEKPDMPPPKMPVKKTKKPKKGSSISSTRSTRSTVSSENQESTVSRDSDLVLEKPVIETFTLSDSDDENERNKTGNQKNQNSNSKSDAVEDVPTTRTTRTKTRMKKQLSEEENPKRNRSPSTDVDKKSNKPSQSTRKTKRKKSEESPPKEQSVYEDAESTVSNNTEVTSSELLNDIPKDNCPALNETSTIEQASSGKAAIQNETMVISTPQVLKGRPMNIEDLMTDDEDDNITVTLPKKVTKIVGNSKKAIFSPFDGSPVKKRVEAFERLGAEVSSDIPVRTTRTKTKALKERNGEAAPTTPVPTNDKEKKTPQMANRYIAALSHSTSKTMRTNLNESFIPLKSASALKASQMEYRERELQRREKESEAMKKREALMRAQIEEKKKKERLEKQIKAQQTREALEKTKIRRLEEIERAKEEKRKQVLAGKQDKIRKIQEETERKRAEVQRRAMEEKKKEEERKKAAEEELERLKQQEHKKGALEADPRRTVTLKKKTKNVPIYMRQRAPLLPTEDCYDSDDGHDKPIKKPTWTSKERAEQQLRIMSYIDRPLVSHFFQSNATTPDLRDIFEYIDPNKLKRTSSAIWKVAPRFTLMPETIAEDGEE